MHTVENIACCVQAPTLTVPTDPPSTNSRVFQMCLWVYGFMCLPFYLLCSLHYFHTYILADTASPSQLPLILFFSAGVLTTVIYHCLEVYSHQDDLICRPISAFYWLCKYLNFDTPLSE